MKPALDVSQFQGPNETAEIQHVVEDQTRRGSFSRGPGGRAREAVPETCGEHRGKDSQHQDVTQLLRPSAHSPTEAGDERQNACVEQNVQLEKDGKGFSARDACQERTLFRRYNAAFLPLLQSGKDGHRSSLESSTLREKSNGRLFLTPDCGERPAMLLPLAPARRLTPCEPRAGLRPAPHDNCRASAAHTPARSKHTTAAAEGGQRRANTPRPGRSCDRRWRALPAATGLRRNSDSAPPLSPAAPGRARYRLPRLARVARTRTGCSRLYHRAG